MNEELEFSALSEEECLMLLPAGVHDFYVADATINVSKNTGNKSIKLTLEITKDGITYKVYDYLSPSFRRKFKHFFDSVGLTDEYKAGRLSPENCKGKCGVAKITRNVGDEKFEPRNEVKDYIKINDLSDLPPKPQNQELQFDSDIPF